jgi:hypothetical protein
MIITDYERATHLKDVAISLTREEAQDLALYLGALLNRPSLGSVHLVEVDGTRIEKDLRIFLADA